MGLALVQMKPFATLPIRITFMAMEARTSHGNPVCLNTLRHTDCICRRQLSTLLIS